MQRCHPCDRQHANIPILIQSLYCNSVDKVHYILYRYGVMLASDLTVWCVGTLQCLGKVTIEFVACTCCVPLQPQGLCSVVIGWSSLWQDLDCLAEQLKCSLQIPSLCCRNTPHLQLFHLLQQLCVKATVWQWEINRLKKHSSSIDRYRGNGNTETSPRTQLGLKCHVFFFFSPGTGHVQINSICCEMINIKKAVTWYVETHQVISTRSPSSINSSSWFRPGMSPKGVLGLNIAWSTALSCSEAILPVSVKKAMRDVKKEKTRTPKLQLGGEFFLPPLTSAISTSQSKKGVEAELDFEICLALSTSVFG